MRRSLVTALGLSLALHLAALLAPGLHLTRTAPPERLSIDVVLKRPAVPKVLPRPQEAPPPQAQQAQSKTAEKTTAPPRRIAAAESREKVAVPPSELPALPDATEQKETVTGDKQGDGITEEAEHVEAAADEPFRLPPSGAIRYTIYYGDQDGQIIGRTRSEWSIQDGTYRIFSSAETAGLAALFKDLRIEQESVGVIAPEGLRPQRFTIRRNGEDKGENASFDWTKKTVRVGRDNTESPLVPGAQDLLSLQYQLGWIPEIIKGTDLPVATGKKFRVYRVEALGQELIPTPLGLLRTLHVRTAGDDVTEIWLAIDLRLLPVKIRFTDRDKRSFESVADEVTFAGEKMSPASGSGSDSATSATSATPPPEFFSSQTRPDKPAGTGDAGASGRIFRPPDNLY